ncbi:TPA: type II toxin-antitoxin system Phd/YefM family antitoxin [Staphylococcus pseudintermedius]|uniref:type II toxin-antitoxin system Phd/YefM family antitoxin n=1 Tax=Staphylococcus pseudintermedius TaxID=283734 RepID=UPI0036F3306A
MITTTTNDRNTVLMSESHYNSLIETLYFLQSPANTQRLAKSIAEAAQGHEIALN